MNNKDLRECASDKYIRREDSDLSELMIAQGN